MARKKRKELIIENIKIEGVADKGFSVGRFENRVVFVRGAVPGDIVDVNVYRKRKDYMEGFMEVMHEPSKDRVEPFCSHFGVCGGCKWQHLDYQAQLHHKWLEVKNALTRIGKLDIPEVPPVLPAQKTKYYRNKLEFTCSNKKWLTKEQIDAGILPESFNAVGFHRPRAFDKIVDIQHCYLQDEPSNEIRNEVRRFALEHEYSFFDIKKQEGFLRQMFVRSASTGEVMIIIGFFYEDVERRMALLDHLRAKFPQITSLMYVVNTKLNNTIFDQDVICHSGQDFIYEELGHVRFRVGPKSFFQTNTEQALELYKIIADFADLKGTENVYDLYTGIGSIACFVANKCRQITGVEEIEAAIEDARKNAALNNLTNTSFYAGLVRNILDESFWEKHGKPDLVITDPPRGGMHAKVVNILLELAAPRIIYVSCNPATQARDLNLMKDMYKVDKIQPVDMFPHTYHIENVALLKRVV